MLQSVNPENKNDESYQNNNPSSCRISKCKGKPFWLNLSQNKKSNYERYKTKPPQRQAHMQTDMQVRKSAESLSNQQVPKEHQSHYFQIILSDNQNYQQDFQSHQYSIKNTKVSSLKLPQFRKNNLTPKRQSHICRKQNLSLLNTPLTTPNSKRKKNKTSKSLFKTQNQNITAYDNVWQRAFDIDRQLLLPKNTQCLKRVNLSLIREVQNLRTFIPIIIKNYRQIVQQNRQIDQLRRLVQKAVSMQYFQGIQLDKSQTQLDFRRLQMQLKKWNSPKYQKKYKKVLNDQFVVQLKPQQKVRQELLNQTRIYCLRQQRLINLEQKINMYINTIKKIQSKQRILQFHNLERRKIFLQWDLGRMKNQFDLHLIQNIIQIQDFQAQIRQIQSQIKHRQILIKQSKKQNQKVLIAPEKAKKSPQILCKGQKQSQIKSFQKRTDLSTQMQQQQQRVPCITKQQPQHDISKPKSDNLQSVSLREKKHKIKQNSKLKIRIKKSIYRDTYINQQLQELIL